MSCIFLHTPTARKFKSKGALQAFIDRVQNQVGTVGEQNPQEELDQVMEVLRETGLAGRTLILSPARIAQRLTSLGQSAEVIPNGFVYNGDVYLNEDALNSNVAIHEYGHLYLNWLKDNRSDIFNRGIDLIQTEEGQPYIEFVRQNQPNLSGDALLEEALTQSVSDAGERLVKNKNNSPLKQWFKEMWDAVKAAFGITQYSAEQLANVSLKEFTDAVVNDLLRGERQVDIQKIKEDAKNGTNLPERFSQAERRGFEEGDRVLSEGILYLGSLYGSNRGGETRANQARDLKKFAKEVGEWIDVSSYGEPDAFGHEAYVWLNSETNKVVKAISPKLYNSYLQLLDKIVFQNTIFPSQSLKVLGFGEYDGDVRVVVEQDIIEGKPTTEKERVSFMEGLGFQYRGEDEFTNDRYIVSDVTANNLLKTENGYAMVDPVIKLNTPEMKKGGMVNTTPIRFQIIGETAAQKDELLQQNLNIAKEMFGRGEDDRVIKYATGWEYDDAEDKWKAETEDTFKVNDVTKNGSLMDTLSNADELFKLYPALKNVQLEIVSEDEDYWGVVDNNVIRLNSKAIKQATGSFEANVKDILVHEIQHLIQAEEGFENGGNIQHLRELGAEDPYSTYFNLAGEVEARNAADRSQMSAEERRETLFSDTEDVAGADKLYYQPSAVSRLEQAEKDTIRKEAEANGTLNLAPNGKPSNLTEDQWLAVRTEAFKKWFGDWQNNPKDASKVVDANGEPLIVYHGTGEQFDTFEKSRFGQTDYGYLGKGIYFANTYDHAEMYAKIHSGNNKQVYPAFLSMKNPNIYTEENGVEYLNGERMEYGRVTRDGKEIHHTDALDYNKDGVISGTAEYVVFDPNQVKSIDNNGNFSLTSNNIYQYSPVANVSRLVLDEGNKTLKTIQDGDVEGLAGILGITVNEDSFNKFVKDVIPQLTIENYQNALFAERVNDLYTAFPTVPDNLKLAGRAAVHFLSRVENITSKIAQLSEDEREVIADYGNGQSLTELYLQNREELQYLNLENRIQPEGLPEIEAVCI